MSMQLRQIENRCDLKYLALKDTMAYFLSPLLFHLDKRVFQQKYISIKLTTLYISEENNFEFPFFVSKDYRREIHSLPTFLYLTDAWIKYDLF